MKLLTSSKQARDHGQLMSEARSNRMLQVRSQSFMKVRAARILTEKRPCLSPPVKCKILSDNPRRFYGI